MQSAPIWASAVGRSPSPSTPLASTTSSTGRSAIETSHNEAGRHTRPMSFSRVTERLPAPSRLTLGIFAAWLLTACGYDTGTRWISQGASTPVCTLGLLRCAPELERCEDGLQGAHWALADDCSSRGLICSTTLEACTVCEPSRRSCSGQTIMQCDDSGAEQTPLDTCDPGDRQVCRDGNCVNLCALASQRRSNVGCEYFAVDLDNEVLAANDAASLRGQSAQ